MSLVVPTAVASRPRSVSSTTNLASDSRGTTMKRRTPAGRVTGTGVTPAGAAVAAAPGVAVPAVIVGAEVSRFGSSLRSSQMATTATTARAASAAPAPTIRRIRFLIQSSGGFREIYDPLEKAGFVQLRAHLVLTGSRGC